MGINDIEIVKSLEGLDWCLDAIGAPKVWDKTKGEGVKIALIDTGVDASHPDLKDKIKYNFNAIDRSYNVTDEMGHGTMTAGLLVGEKTGVAPNAELYSIKVLDSNGHGSMAHVMDGISNAISLGVDILSISLGASYHIPLIIEQRIVDACSKGIIVVGAVGNDGANEPMYPAKLREAIGVGGYDKNFMHVNFSNRGHNVLAPSTEILSTFRDGGYARMSGTSFASPLVAGGIALIISYYRSIGKELKPKEIKDMISGNFDLTKLIK